MSRFKFSRVYFLPAAGLAALLAQSHHAAHHGHNPAHAASAYSALLYLLSPWGAGHLLLYAAAAATRASASRCAPSLAGLPWPTPTLLPLTLP